MVRGGAERIVSDFPIEAVVFSKMTAERQFLEGKDTRVTGKGVEPLRQEDIEIQVKASKPVHR
jgi:hypothetical protein